MRVISGEAKGKKLFSPPGTRPTAGKARESFFNILGKEVFSAKVLDLFAGTGALGIEALSRGAKEAVFVDNNYLSCRAVKRNIANLSLGNQSAIYRLGVDKALKLFSRKGYKFDIIFMDPPYGSGLATRTLVEISRNNTLSNGGVVVVEHYRKNVLPEAVEELKIKRKAVYGDTAVSFYVRSGCHETCSGL